MLFMDGSYGCPVKRCVATQDGRADEFVQCRLYVLKERCRSDSSFIDAVNPDIDGVEVVLRVDE